jgi:DNA replication and repair protein RecF
MLLKQIIVEDFRNFHRSIFYFNPFTTIIIGKNSVGKTNLLEAVFFSLKGRGFRERTEDELISSHQKKTSVQIEIVEKEEKTQLKIFIERSNSLVRKVEKSYFINKYRKQTHLYILQALPVVIFSPNFIYVIDGDPADRRAYFDNIITVFDIEYKKRLINYENALRKRNKILEFAKNMQKLKEELSFWDDYLIEQADYITHKRRELISLFNKHKQLDSINFHINYLANEISKTTLAKTFTKQLVVKKTLVGPQRDDFTINRETIDGLKNLHKFGSRSEQRLALFWLVLNEINLYQERLNKRPLVLLDDIFSELDLTNRALVLKLIKKYQTIITTTQPDILDLVDIPHTIINLK